MSSDCTSPAACLLGEGGGIERSDEPFHILALVFVVAEVARYAQRNVNRKVGAEHVTRILADMPWAFVPRCGPA